MPLKEAILSTNARTAVVNYYDGLLQQFLERPISRTLAQSTFSRLSAWISSARHYTQRAVMMGYLLMRQKFFTLSVKYGPKCDLQIMNGMVLWDFSGPERTEQEQDSEFRKNFFRCFDSLVHGDFVKTPANTNELHVICLQIPRDVIYVYADVDPDVVRKLELTHHVRIFSGRDFEKLRDNSQRSLAPNGVARFCVYGRYRNIMDVKRILFGWMELQGDYKEEEVKVPEYAVGNVIGRQGARVAQMQLDSKAKIDVQTRDERHDEDFILVQVTGRRPARARAKQLLQDCVDHSERMREKDRVRDAIRDVRERIMYHKNEDSDFEGQPDEMEYEPWPVEQPAAVGDKVDATDRDYGGWKVDPLVVAWDTPNL